MSKDIIKKEAMNMIKDMTKDVYEDVAKPAAKSTGELVELVPRAIKAALAPVEKWVLQREYNIAETKKLLEEKLKNTSPELIQAPEPHIAVPALQYISYCMDNEELRDMYANLLANSMNVVAKNGVHPGFVEIIKQLSPDEAKILRYISNHRTIPVITLRFENEKGEGHNIINKFSNIGEMTECEEPFETGRYFDNLIRLGLLECPTGISLTDKSLYDSIKTHDYILTISKRAESQKEYNKVNMVEKHIVITDFGEAFCKICLG